MKSGGESSLLYLGAIMETIFMKGGAEEEAERLHFFVAPTLLPPSPISSTVAIQKVSHSPSSLHTVMARIPRLREYPLFGREPVGGKRERRFESRRRRLCKGTAQ